MDKGGIFQHMEFSGAAAIANAVEREVADLPFAREQYDTIIAGMIAIVDRETGERCLWPITNASSPEEAAELLERAAQQLRGAISQGRVSAPH